MTCSKSVPSEYELGHLVAIQLVNSNGDDALKLFHDLRRNRKLHIAVQQMNRLLDEHGFEDLITSAFRPIGLEHGG
jgi:hypothetical protein